MTKAIKIKFTYDKLDTLNEVWNLLDTITPISAKQKAMLSAIQDVALKLKRKQVGLEFKYEATSEYGINLKYHEAYFFEMYLRDICSQFPLGYTRTIVYKYADIINQKLA